jgi:hypothetical protein
MFAEATRRDRLGRRRGCTDGPTAAAGDAAALAAAIRDADAGDDRLQGAGQVRGVDPQGRSVVSAETVARMQALLRERGLVIEATGGDLPVRGGALPVGRAGPGRRPARAPERRLRRGGHPGRALVAARPDAWVRRAAAGPNRVSHGARLAA